MRHISGNKLRTGWVDHIKVYENGNISVHFKFADEFRKTAEYIEINTTDAAGKTDERVAEESLASMESWMKEPGLVMNITEPGANEEMLKGISIP